MTTQLRLFVAGDSARSIRAAANLRAFLDSAVGDRYNVDVIDVLDRPDLADDAGIMATPTVIKDSPLPTRRVIGDLSDITRLSEALGIDPTDQAQEERP